VPESGIVKLVESACFQGLDVGAYPCIAS
jgi:hypothetical protein